jgi:8-oxo-dGTP pyrophosphatase MutT (NUDIX family)
MRIRVMEQDDGKARFVDYQRTRLRIARATAFNLFFLLPCGGVFIGLRTDLGVWRLAAFEAITFGAFVGSLWSAERIGDAYVDRLVEAYQRAVQAKGETERREPVKTKNGTKEKDRESEEGRRKNDTCERAAAVCYRIKNTRPQFLLVSTKDGKRWTFPKGHLEGSESGPQAAQREAREEAGAIGEPESRPLITYQYPAGDAKKDCDEIAVTAYLLKVTRRQKPAKDEPKRMRGWYRAAKAKEKLGECRKKTFRQSHAEVVDAAVSRIGEYPAEQTKRLAL